MTEESNQRKDIQKIVDERIEDHIQEQENRIEKLERENKKLKSRIAENTENKSETKNISRRQFLKKASLGVAGLGALSLSPAAANLKLTKNGIFGSNSLNQKIQDIETLNSNKANIINESYVKFSLSSNQTGISSLTLTNPFDTTEIDNRSEANNSQGFKPDETGKYIILARIRMDPGNSGDSIRLRLQNITDGALVDRLDAYETGGSSNVNFLTGSWIGELNSSKTYEIQVQDTDSSYGIIANSTSAEIFKSVVHP